MYPQINWLYPQGRHRAVTFSYDDGRIHDRKVVSLLNQYGMKGTFNLNSGPILEGLDKYVTKEEIPELYKGHEVAVHTTHHLFLERLPSGQILSEIQEDRKVLERLAGYPIIGMAYPNGTWNNTVREQARAAGICYSRTTQDTLKFSLPMDWLAWGATCHHRDAMTRMEAFKSGYYAPLSVFYIWGHSFEFNNDNNWDLLEQICETLPKDEVTWYATNGEIYRYVEAMRQLVLTAEQDKVYNPTATEVWFKWNKSDEPRSVKPGELLTF